MTDEERIAKIARQEEYWTAPRLISFGLAFLTVAISFIYLMSSL